MEIETERKDVILSEIGLNIFIRNVFLYYVLRCVKSLWLCLSYTKTLDLKLAKQPEIIT